MKKGKRDEHGHPNKKLKSYKDDVFVGVNGKGYRIQRGVDVEVPESVANVLEESARQDAAIAALIERETAAGKKAINEMA